MTQGHGWHGSHCSEEGAPFPDVHRDLMASGALPLLPQNRPAHAGQLGLTGGSATPSDQHGTTPRSANILKGWDKTAAQSRDGLGLACSAPCTGLSAGLTSGFCAVSGPPHPAPRPSQPLPAASNATDTAGPAWLGSGMTSGHPERCQGGVGSERLVLCNRFFQWDPIPPIRKLVFWLQQHLETEILKSQIPASLSPWECDFYSPFSHLEAKEPAIGVLYPAVRRQHCGLKGVC